MSNEAEVMVTSWQRDGELLESIRRRVFVEEQGVPESVVFDGQDADAVQYLVSVDGAAVGCGRRLADGKVGRLAILPAQRGRGLGAQLLAGIIREATDSGVTSLYLHAQQQALGFYQLAGFTATGEPFEEAGIPHLRMEIALPKPAGEQFIAGVTYPHPFAELACRLCASASHTVRILSPQLDHEVFDDHALSDALSALARKSRHTSVHILIADSRPLVKRGHQLLNLARRIPSSVEIRKLAHHPQWHGETIVIRDRDGVLFKPGDVDHEGFYEPQARASAARHIELFDELWQRAAPDVELRVLGL
jgi:predicted GNAT family N-acyltransferase